VVVVDEIKKDSSGGFYPAKITDTAYSMDNNYNGPFLTRDDILEGKTSPLPPLVPLYHIHYDVETCRTDVHFPKINTDLIFPDQTLVLDKIKNKNFIVGLTEKEYEEHIKNEAKNLRSQYDRDSGYILPDPNSKRKVEDYIPRAPFGYRRAFFIIGVNLIILSLLARHFFIRWKEQVKKIKR
jgi:hypothetical protein